MKLFIKDCLLFKSKQTHNILMGISCYLTLISGLFKILLILN